jgi:hypothetical protein
MMNHEHTARTVLSLAGVNPAEQAAILDELARRLDRTAALARRDYWINRAAEQVGNVGTLARLMHRFRSNAWPNLRHLPGPPANETELRKIFFWVNQAIDDMGADVPGERQLRRIIS